MKYILAIDQGTTGSRVIVYDNNGRKVAAAYEEFRQYFPRPGWVGPYLIRDTIHPSTCSG